MSSAGSHRLRPRLDVSDRDMCSSPPRRELYINSESVPTRPTIDSPLSAAPMDDQYTYGAAKGPGEGRPRGAEVEVPPAPLGFVALHNLMKATKGTLSLDLKRKLFKGGAPGDSLLRVQPGSAAGLPSGRRRPAARPPPRAAGYYGQAPPQAPPGAYAASGGGYRGSTAAPRPGVIYDLPSVSFMNTGARIKVMRHLQLGPMFEVEGRCGKRRVPALDLGIGFAFELDTAELQPQARLKVRDLVSLKALPYPALKLSKRLALPESSWGVRLSYECPLEALGSFYRPPARLLLSIDNMHSTGVQLTQAGLEFNYAGDFAGGSTRMRAAGLVALPRELPVVEGQPLVGLELKRLGLKATW